MWSDFVGASCRVKNLKNGLYQIHFYTGFVYEGSLEKVSKIAFHHNIDRDEVHQAIFEMQEYGHTYAEFGIFGMLLYTAGNEKNAS